MARLDPHSYADLDQGRIARLDLVLAADFGARVLSGTVALHLAAPASGGPLDLDTRDLAIERVTSPGGAALPHVLHPAEPILGQRLTVELPAGATGLVVTYRTSPDASALQWLAPEQTSGGEHPFLFSQCQAIHARSVVPLQDTPRARVTYQATLEAPEPLRAVMAAAMDGPGPGSAPGTRAWRFHMPQPIPPYLLALAVGHLDEAGLGPRSSVYAEPEVLARAAWEFAEVEAMIRGAEALYGPYPWDRFDLLLMPPAFPYGGMENPRLTFLTPTLIAGDRSQVNVVVHELAHSWSGNLVTNADMEHFWLNEGFTVYAERRILEALEGPELAALQATVGRNTLQREVDRIGAGSPLTQLRTHLAGVDPDEAFSQVPYEKGFLFLALLERTVGRPRFDAFLRRYLDAFRFQSITTETFCAFLEAELPGALAQVDGPRWLHQPGIPDNEPRFQSARRDAVAALAAAWAAGARPDPEVARRWSPEEWLIYLQGLPATLAVADCEVLDRQFQLSGQGNAEILGAWLTVAAASGHEPAILAALAFVGRMGRMKFLKPLYRALASCPAARDQALARFEAVKHTYHPIARMVVQSTLRAAT